MGGHFGERLFLHGERSIELDTPEIKRTVFVLPEWLTKNKEARVVVLNDVAQRIIDGVRDQHPAYVFTWMDRKGRRPRFTRLNNSGWKAARRRAAARYPEELGRAAPEEFRHVRVHDAPEIGNLVAAVNRIADSRGIHARTVLRLGA